MNQTVKPDRPIWPPVPEPTVPPDPQAPQPGTGERETAAADFPIAEVASSPLCAFEGFGSFSG